MRHLASLGVGRGRWSVSTTVLEKEETRKEIHELAGENATAADKPPLEPLGQPGASSKGSCFTRFLKLGDVHSYLLWQIQLYTNSEGCSRKVLPALHVQLPRE